MEIVGSDELLACVGFALSSAANELLFSCRRLKSLQVWCERTWYKLNPVGSGFQDLVENLVGAAKAARALKG